MIEFLRENIVFFISSILIVGGLVTVTQQKTGVLESVPAEMPANVSDTDTSQAVPTTVVETSSSTQQETVTNTIPKSIIRRPDEDEDEGFDD